MFDYFCPGIAAFLIFAVFVPIVVRIEMQTSAIIRVFYLAITVEVIMILIGLTSLETFYPWHATAAYGVLFMLLWFAYGAVAKSISLIIAVQLAQQPDNKMKINDASQIAHNEFDTRIKLLCDVGYTKHHDCDKYSITEQGKSFANKIIKIRSILSISVNGLYN